MLNIDKWCKLFELCEKLHIDTWRDLDLFKRLAGAANGDELIDALEAAVKCEAVWGN